MCGDCRGGLRGPGVGGARLSEPLADTVRVAEAAGRVVAADIAARLRSSEPPPPYESDGNCYIEFGGGLAGRVEVNFLDGSAPTARIMAPSRELAAEKDAFAATRQQLVRARRARGSRSGGNDHSATRSLVGEDG